MPSRQCWEPGPALRKELGKVLPLLHLTLAHGGGFVHCFSDPQKKSKDHFGLEGDEESTMLEESVSPKK